VTALRNFTSCYLDNGRTGVLADAESRETLDCIRCGACLNACPVIPANWRPCLWLGLRRTDWRNRHSAVAVDANIPSRCLTLRLSAALVRSLPGENQHFGDIDPSARQSGRTRDAPLSERMAMRPLGLLWRVLAGFPWRKRLVRIGQRPFEHDGMLHNLPECCGMDVARDLSAIPKESFREWCGSGSKRNAGTYEYQRARIRGAGSAPRVLGDMTRSRVAAFLCSRFRHHSRNDSLGMAERSRATVIPPASGEIVQHPIMLKGPLADSHQSLRQENRPELAKKASPAAFMAIRSDRVRPRVRPLCAQMDQYLRNVDFTGRLRNKRRRETKRKAATGNVASMQLRSDDCANRSGVDRAISMASSCRIPDMHSGRHRKDTVQRLSRFRIRQNAGPAVVE